VLVNEHHWEEKHYMRGCDAKKFLYLVFRIDFPSQNLVFYSGNQGYVGGSFMGINLSVGADKEVSKAISLFLFICNHIVGPFRL